MIPDLVTDHCTPVIVSQSKSQPPTHHVAGVHEVPAVSAGAGRGVQHGEGAASGDEGELAPWNTAAASTQPATMSSLVSSLNFCEHLKSIDICFG